jgi:hypothetical protein
MNTYTSRYTDKLITAAQYLAEMMCERQAKKEKKDLCKQFWNTDYWIRPFKTQLRFANQLLKIYSCEAITNALKSNQGKNIYSLNAKWLDPLIREEQRKIDSRIPEVKKVEETPIITNVSRPVFKPKKTILDELD